MLIRFTVENFLSFKERIDFNMIASPEDRFPHHIVKNEDDAEDIGLLRTSVIYGANASGKSNLVRSIAFAKKLIIDGVDKNKNIPVKLFKLDKACLTQPARFEFEFKYKNKQYAYGFIVNEASVLEEWLFEIGVNKEIMVFERQEQTIDFNFDADLLTNISKDEKQRLDYEAQGTRRNLLFLTNTIERDVDYFQNIYEWFDDKLIIIFPRTKPTLLSLLFPNEKDDISEKFCELLHLFDFDIEEVVTNDIELDESNIIPDTIKSEVIDDFPHDKEKGMMFLPQFNTAIFKKDGVLLSKELFLYKKDNSQKNVEFEIKEESDGTQRFIDLIPMLLQLMNQERVFFVDEIENSLHTLLIQKIFDYILNAPNIREKPSQLITTTHEVLLLNTALFRKDEIWFAEKNKQGISHFFSLANTEIDDLDLVKGYLKGRFGAIPLFQDLNILGKEL
ncbi:ATP-binding protein [Candidatus Albibeggiatoa sp. nov. NOAA]|uniref:AAA family ATPase n=1 Tax=Candidatus Albibeggiatoa sp. nov. NOAA TaxID=3162724 RepID=UPI0032FDFF1A|nr:ATP-binding protein [Thiotrichaceae bacterium]